METTPTAQDFTFNIVHQERYSRGELLLRSFFGFLYIGIPHLFLLLFMNIAAAVLSLVAWFAILFTGQYPRSFFEFRLGVLRWQTRVYARLFNLSDDYPAFGSKGSDDKTRVDIVYPQSQSRILLLVRLIFGFIYILIPHGFCLFFRAIATYFVVFIAWWAVLITGTYPKGMHDFVTGTFRWGLRVGNYYSYMTDKYPPFSGK